MTVWHHKGELVHLDGVFATYRFFPDHVMAPTVHGLFRVDLKAFESEITEPADAEAKGLVSTDAHCVAALTHKIKKAIAASGVPPAEVLFIA